MNRILILAHREELIYQAVEHAKNAGLTAGIEMGGQWARKETVIVSTVQTLNSRGRESIRMQKFDPYDFGLVVTDEAHHATARSYRAVYEWFKQNPRCKFLGVTATPMRADGIGLHNVFETCAYEMELAAAIQLGWLVPIRQQFVTVDALNLAKVGKKPGGDLKDGELERAFLGETDEQEEELLHTIAKPTIDAAGSQQGIVFASGVEHAEKLTAAFNAYDNVHAECILGETDSEVRRQIVRRFKGHETQFLINVGVATEGFDAPSVAIVAVARPTMSMSLYMQMIGRGTRPLPGLVDQIDDPSDRREAISKSQKTHCLVLDFVGNSGQHKLISVADVLAGETIDDEIIFEAVQEAKKDSQPVDMQSIMEKIRQAREDRIQRELEEAEERKRKQTQHYAESARVNAIDVDLFAGRKFDPFVDYKPSPDGATQKQVNYLMRLGVKPEVAINYSMRQARAVIDNLQAKQQGANFVIPFGVHQGKKLGDLPASYLHFLKIKGIGGENFQQHIRRMEEETA